MVAVDPCGANTYDGHKGEDPAMGLARFGGDIQTGEERPSGNAHTGGYEDDDDEQAQAIAHVSEVTLGVGFEQAPCVSEASAYRAGEVRTEGHVIVVHYVSSLSRYEFEGCSGWCRSVSKRVGKALRACAASALLSMPDNKE